VRDMGRPARVHTLRDATNWRGLHGLLACDTCTRIAPTRALLTSREQPMEAAAP